MILNYIKYHNDTAYIVKREIAKHMFMHEKDLRFDWVQMYRDEMGYDHVLQDDAKFYFCEVIKEVEIIEDEN
jgi:hypothetical protein